MMSDLSIPVNLRDFGRDDADPRRVGGAGGVDTPATPRRYGIQFRKALSSDEFLKMQQEFGLALNVYVAELTYIELVDQETLERLRVHPLVNGVFPYASAYKIAPEIGSIKAQVPRRGEATGFLLWAVLFPEAKPAATAAAIERLGATGVHVRNDRRQGGVARVVFTAPSLALIEKAAELDAVRWIEEVPEAHSDSGMPSAILESGNLNRAPFAAVGLRGKNQRIGVLETGSLDIDHCWFRGPAPNTPGATHRKVVASNDTFPMTWPKHAAFVVGLLCGDPANADPDAARGIACDARVVYGNRDDFAGTATDLTLLDYLKKAARARAYVHNNSWHSTDSVEYSQNAVDVDTFAWDHEECLVVGSSGRKGQTQRGAPGVAKNALCVSAAYVGDEGSCFANGIVGPSKDQRRKPDLVALGCGLVSAIAQSDCDAKLDETISDDDKVTPCCAPGEVFCATSFATPIVSAAAAIVRQYFVEGWYPTGHKTVANRLPKPSGALLKAVLLNSTEKTTCGGGYPNDDEGWGLLQLDRVLFLGAGKRKLRVWDVHHAKGLVGDDELAFAFEIANNGAIGVPLKVTLVWTDPPGEASSYLDPVVNNLDLEVIDPDETHMYRGNVFSGGESVVGGGADTRNNVEMVLLNRPKAGGWRVVVKGTRILHQVQIRPQGFALVVTGNLA